MKMALSVELAYEIDNNYRIGRGWPYTVCLMYVH